MDISLKSEIGKIVLCQAWENNTSRVQVKEINSNIKDTKKNIFTVLTEDCQIGYVLCKILRFRVDRNGYDNMIVEPYKFLGENIDSNSVAFIFLAKSGEFSQYFRGSDYTGNTYSEEIVAAEYASRINDNLYAGIFDLLMIDLISFKELEQMLMLISPVESLAINLFEDKIRRTGRLLQRYPYLKRYLRDQQSAAEIRKTLTDYGREIQQELNRFSESTKYLKILEESLRLKAEQNSEVKAEEDIREVAEEVNNKLRNRDGQFMKVYPLIAEKCPKNERFLDAVYSDADTLNWMVRMNNNFIPLTQAKKVDTILDRVETILEYRSSQKKEKTETKKTAKQAHKK